MDFSKEDWQQERFRNRAERQEGFGQFRIDHPIWTRLWLGYCGYADSAFEAMLVRGDAEAFQRSVATMLELASWLTNTSPQIDVSPQDSFKQLLQAGFDSEQAFALAQERPKRRRGRPVSKRHLGVQALELRMHRPQPSWTKLAIKLCQCKLSKHNEQCGQRIRHQVMELEDTLKRLQV